MPVSRLDFSTALIDVDLQKAIVPIENANNRERIFLQLDETRTAKQIIDLLSTRND